MERLYEEFGRRLRARRKEAELTQSEVAERVGLTRTSITNIEAGRQHVVLHQLLLLASIVGVEPQDLLPREPAALEQLVSTPKTLKAIQDSKNTDDVEAIRKVLSTARTSQRRETATS